MSTETHDVPANQTAKEMPNEQKDILHQLNDKDAAAVLNMREFLKYPTGHSIETPEGPAAGGKKPQTEIGGR